MRIWAQSSSLFVFSFKFSKFSTIFVPVLFCNFLRIWNSFLLISLASKYLQPNFKVWGVLRSLSTELISTVLGRESQTIRLKLPRPYFKVRNWQMMFACNWEKKFFQTLEKCIFRGRNSKNRAMVFCFENCFAPPIKKNVSAVLCFRDWEKWDL